jgi:tryptophan synthase alpha chain
MPDRYETTFAQLKSSSEHAFIPFTLLGWPNADQSFEIIRTLIDAGAAALELGFAFSDPVADGPIIQAAAFETIEANFRLSDAFVLLTKIREYNSEIPIGLLLYFNTVLSQGIDTFFQRAAIAGVDSVLIADLPAECADEITGAAEKHGIAPVFIISPLTTKERLQQIANVAGGYLYVVSRLGITGVHESFDSDLGRLLKDAKQVCGLPLCVGFGVSTPQQARLMIEQGADGVITGSRIIQLIRESGNLSRLSAYVKEMTGAVKHAANEKTNSR